LAVNRGFGVRRYYSHWVLLSLIAGAQAFYGQSATAQPIALQPTPLPLVTIEESRDFRSVPSKDPRILLVLASTVGPFPTFNVIRQPGNLTLRQDRLAQDTLTSYRESGFIDVRLVSSPSLLQTQEDHSWEVMELAYSHGGKSYTAQIGYLNLNSEHLIATMIGQAENVVVDRTKWRQVLRSISVHGASGVGRDAPRSNAPIIVGITLSLALGLGILALFWNRTSRKA